MRIEQLQYLVAIADIGSFTAASEQLFIAQPSISQAILALEKELNVEIFIRSRMGVIPTDVGNQIIASARRILDEVAQIRRISKEYNEEIISDITIATVPIFSKELIDFIAGNHQHSIQVAFHLVESNTDSIEQMIQRGAADLGIVLKADDAISEYAQIDFTALSQAKLVAYMWKDNPLAQKESITFAELTQCPILKISEGYATYEYALSRISEYGTPNIVFTINNPERAPTLVENTDRVYFGLITKNNFPSAITQERNVSFVPIADAIDFSFGAIYKKSARSSKLLFTLISDLLQLCIEKGTKK